MKTILATLLISLMSTNLAMAAAIFDSASMLRDLPENTTFEFFTPDGTVTNYVSFNVGEVDGKALYYTSVPNSSCKISANKRIPYDYAGFGPQVKFRAKYSMGSTSKAMLELTSLDNKELASIDSIICDAIELQTLQNLQKVLEKIGYNVRAKLSQ